MVRKKHLVVLGSVILVTLIVLNLSGGVVARLKLSFSSFFLPLFGIANTSSRVVDRSVEALVPRSELIKQNADLRKENQELKIRGLQTQQAVRENERVRQLIGWQKQIQWRLKLANVVGREPANWWRTVEIDLGSRDGIRTNLSVLTVDGLVGRVSSVGFTRSQVVLIGDPSCRVAAMVDNSTRDQGVVLSGSSPLDPSLVDLGYLSHNAVLKPGQDVYTSGLGGVFPKGIPIGKVIDFRPVEYGLYNQARVKLAANLSSLEEVWVMFP